MKAFPSEIKCDLQWRQYQSDALDSLEEHFEDGQLHLIAPPGSGKTIIGLEVLLRLNQASLILAPSIAIRNQWKARFIEHFCKNDSDIDWISTDINTPSFLTISTYQGLYAAAKKKNVAKILKKLKISSLLLDEAHHLKNAWWYAVMNIKETLKPTVVSLTATPPIDSTRAEWSRYLALNGPIDVQISIPELVKNNDLCPHQDYIYLSCPSQDEKLLIKDNINSIEYLFLALQSDEILIDIFQQLAMILRPNEHLEFIYDHTELYASILIFLHHVGGNLNIKHFEIIAAENESIPVLDEYWLEILINEFIKDKSHLFIDQKIQKDRIVKQAKRRGLFFNNKINFTNSKKQNAILASSISKLEGIRKIANLEYANMASNLRMLILTDYIRKEYYVHSKQNEVELKKIGVLSIFEGLRRDHFPTKKIAVITGSIVIIPLAASETFRKMVGIDFDQKYKMDYLSYDSNFLLVEQLNKSEPILEQITSLFELGVIEILIGTKSLLGEGWDAPCINSLVMASFVGSFVSSNQMRGRAIRSYKSLPSKTANIWHLASLNLESEHYSLDFEKTKKKFRYFIGPHLHADEQLTNGVQRILGKTRLKNEDAIQKSNDYMFIKAVDRSEMRTNWTIALAKGFKQLNLQRLDLGLSSKYNKGLEQSLKLQNKHLSLSSATAFSTMVYSGLYLADILASLNPQFSLSILAGLGIATLGSGIKSYFSYRTFQSEKNIYQYYQKISECLLQTLFFHDILNADTNMHIRVEESNGQIDFKLYGGKMDDKNLFFEALSEMINPVENPKYVLKLKDNRLYKFIAVPKIVGANKSKATYFFTKWRRNVEKCELIYLRNPAGRKTLFEIRTSQLREHTQPKLEEISIWN